MVESNGSRPLIEVRDVRMYFPVTSGIVFQRKVAEVKAVDDVSITINKGEVLGLVGESGSGKTTLGRVILQLQRQTSGDVFYDGERLNTLSNKELRPIRRKLQVIF
ncbi:MAG: ATP-binding cassette domain-containing protein, partial [Chloroflexota bacterium]|nr:ATP-binding cassette domain-containing protein [Chloroflexota bacterium]